MEKTVNEAGNDGGSVTVVLPNLSGAFAAKRRALGDTPEGRRCANISELLLNRKTATGDHLRRIDASLAIQVRELAQLTN